jgi:hypothetical protein
MLPLSKLSIVNQVLLEIGRLPVTNIDDSPDAELISAKVDLLLPVLLQETHWNFAIKYREDSTPLTTQFSPDYNYTYQLPADFGHLFNWGNFNNNFSDPGAQPFLITDGLINSNSQPITYYYIVNNVDPDALTIMFFRALVLFTASDVSLALTENQSLTSYLRQKYEIEKARAVMRNDMEFYKTSTPYNDYDRIRLV